MESQGGQDVRKRRHNSKRRQAKVERPCPYCKQLHCNKNLQDDYHKLEEWRQEALRDLESRFGNGEDSVSHAENTARNLHPHVSIATPPNLDPRKGNIEARFFCADEDGMKAAIDSQVPIIGNDQQHYQWDSHELPIKQLFDQWKDDQDLKVSVQIPSRRKTAVSHEKRKLKDVLSKFQDDKEPDVPLNVLDMRDRCRNVYPKFLPSIEQELLHLICDGSLSTKSAQRDAVSTAEALRYKIMKEGSLLAQRKVPINYTKIHRLID
ncbi:unnamed protein product [Fusarium langsethiae]|nr:unnamed protein product [Fusarium langsethiae]